MGKQVAARLKKTGFTSDREQKRFCFPVTDKTVRGCENIQMYLENCIYENNPKNVKRLEIGKDIRGVILTDRNIKQVTNQKK